MKDSMKAGFDREQVVPRLKALVESYLKSEAYGFNYSDEYECFEMGFEMDEGLDGCDVDIYLYDDMLSVTACPAYRATEENRDKAAILLNLINNVADYTQLFMDPKDGTVICRSCQRIESVLPGRAEVDVLLGVALDDLNRFDKAIRAVALSGADPHEVFLEAKKKMDEEE